MHIETLINTANNLGDAPNMFHPMYGWLRVDGKLTEAGVQFFADQRVGKTKVNISLEDL